MSNPLRNITPDNDTAPAVQTKGNSPRSSRPRMLSLHFKSGDRKAFDYTHLYRVDLTPGSELRLQFSSDVVILQGTGLEQLYDRLIEHTVAEVFEMDPLHGQAGQLCLVSSISIERPVNDLAIQVP